jgi:hypothetical protein
VEQVRQTAGLAIGGNTSSGSAGASALTEEYSGSTTSLNYRTLQ